MLSIAARAWKRLLAGFLWELHDGLSETRQERSWVRHLATWAWDRENRRVNRDVTTR